VNLDPNLEVFLEFLHVFLILELGICGIIERKPGGKIQVLQLLKFLLILWPRNRNRKIFDLR
jgi:hypothetical protein